MQAHRGHTLPTYFGPGFWATWPLGSIEVVAYVYGLEDHGLEARDEEANLAKQGYLWAAVWSPLTHGIPDHAHESPMRRGATQITSVEALDRLLAIGVSREPLAAQAFPIPQSLGLA